MSRTPAALLPLAEIARRVGVSAAAVSNWRRRHDDFPRATVIDGVELIIEAEAAAWLCERRIPANARRPAEPAGHTYGERFMSGPVEQSASVAQTPAAAERPPLARAWDPIRALADRLGGNVDPFDFAEIVLVLLSLKLWKPLSWREVTSHPNPAEALRHATLTTPAGADLTPTDRLPREVQDPRVLGAVLGVVEGLDVTAAANDPRVRCALLTEVLDLVAVDERSAHHSTPPSVAELMVHLADPRPHERVHDVFGRSGELTVAVVDRLLQGGGELDALQMSCRAPVERHARMSSLGAAFLGVRIALTAQGSDTAPRSADLVLGNPPFNVDGFLPDPNGGWRYGAPPSRSNLGWLQHALATMSDGGRAAVLTSNISTASASVAERRIRATMIDHGVVDAVIALPDRLFTNTGIAVTLWMLRTPAPPGEADVLFVDATGLGELHRRRRTLGPDDIERITGQYRAWRARSPGIPFPGEAGLSAGVGRDLIARSDHVLDPRRMVPQPPTAASPADRRLDLTAALDEVGGALRSLATADSSASQSGSWVLRRAKAPAATDVTHVSLGDVCTPAVGRAAREPSQRDDATPVLVPRNIRRGALQPLVAGRSARPDPALLLRAGDVVGTRVGDVGQFALVGAEHSGWLLGAGCFRLRPGDEVDPAYLGFALRTSPVQNWISRHTGGSAVRNISMSSLMRLPLALPPLAEQRAAGKALAAVAAAAEQHARTAELMADLAELAAGLLMDPLDPR